MLIQHEWVEEYKQYKQEPLLVMIYCSSLKIVVILTLSHDEVGDLGYL